MTSAGDAWADDRPDYLAGDSAAGFAPWLNGWAIYLVASVWRFCAAGK